MHFIYYPLFPFSSVQRMVLPVESRGPEPDVLPLRVRQQKQLFPADQPGLRSQPGPPGLLQVHRPVHCHGPVPRQVHLLGLHNAFLQADAGQKTHHEGLGEHRPRVLQFSQLDQG